MVPRQAQGRAKAIDENVERIAGAASDGELMNFIRH